MVQVVEVDLVVVILVLLLIRLVVEDSFILEKFYHFY